MLYSRLRLLELVLINSNFAVNSRLSFRHDIRSYNPSLIYFKSKEGKKEREELEREILSLIYYTINDTNIEIQDRRCTKPRLFIYKNARGDFMDGGHST